MEITKITEMEISGVITEAEAITNRIGTITITTQTGSITQVVITTQMAIATEMVTTKARAEVVIIIIMADKITIVGITIIE